MIRRFGVQLVRAIRGSHTERYQKVLDDYFKQDHFQFATEKQEANLAKLKEWIPLVYLRNRPLICIDVEAWERNTRLVTEIGFTIYDPHRNQNVIYPSIKPYHIIIKENMNRFNGRYVANNKNKFIGGESYLLPMREAKLLVKKVFEKYLVEKQAVLVGHSVSGDMTWLRSLGIHFPKNVPVVDTLKMHHLSRRGGGRLQTLCHNLDIHPTYLHNAANDSYYTLLVALQMCDPKIRVQKQLDVFLDLPIGPQKSKTAADSSVISPLEDVDEIMTGI